MHLQKLLNLLLKTQRTIRRRLNMSKALGLVEVRGYVAAIEAADSALKAANVTLLD